MKQKSLLSALTLIAAISFTVASCSSGRNSYRAKAPSSKPYVSLIITPSPGFIMNHFPDGRYYHRSQQGFLYWKGRNNQFFLDQEYLKKVNYNKREYNKWKRFTENKNKFKRHRYSY